PGVAYYMSKDGRKTLKDERPIRQAIDQMASDALRTIMICVKPLKNNSSLDIALLEKDLTFVGVYGMIDPPRKEVKSTIKECRQAGIKSVMITGDHAQTARAIAHDINLLPKDGLVLEGADLTQMNTDELEHIIDDVYVFARVTPYNKLKIVVALNNNDYIF